MPGKGINGRANMQKFQMNSKKYGGNPFKYTSLVSSVGRASKGGMWNSIQSRTAPQVEKDYTAPIIDTTNLLTTVSQGTTALGSVTANETVTWSFGSVQSDKNIDASTGVITLNAVATIAGGIAPYTVTATDAGGNAVTTATFSPVVIDIQTFNLEDNWTWIKLLNAPNIKMEEITSSSDGTKLAAVGSQFFEGGEVEDYYGGNIWTSSDSGISWTERTITNAEGVSNLNWECITSSSDGTKLAAVEAGHYSDGGNIWISSDSGATWTERTVGGGKQPWLTIASNSNGNILIAGGRGNTDLGIYVSTDSGAIWVLKNSGNPPTITSSVAINANGTVMASARSGGDIYISPDTGETWTAQGHTPNEGSDYNNWFDLDSNASGNLIIAADANSPEGGVILDTTSGNLTRANAGEYQSVAVTSSSSGEKLACVVQRGSISGLWTYSGTVANFNAVAWSPRVMPISTDIDEMTGMPSESLWRIASSSDGNILTVTTYKSDNSGGDIWRVIYND